MVASVSACNVRTARAYMVVCRLKVNIRGTAEEVRWRASRNAAAPCGVAVAARLRYENGSAPVAQLDRALPSEGRGHKFESCRARHLRQGRREQSRGQ